MNIKEIKKLFDDGKLKKSEGDYLLIDGAEITLETNKDYSFHSWAEDLAFELLDLVNIPVEGA